MDHVPVSAVRHNSEGDNAIVAAHGGPMLRLI